MDKSTRIPTNLRTLLILETLVRSDRAMTATEISESLGLPKQTVHRLCATLERDGFLARQENSKRYHAARRLRDLGAGLLYNSRHHIARRQILLDVARQVRETVNFVVPEADGMSYLDRVETDWAFQIQLPIGTHVPFHCTASGKCFLASLAPKARRALVSALTLERLTPATRTDPDELLADLADIARRGYSLDEQEFLQGMVAIAVPVTDCTGRFVAALAFHGPTQRLSIAGVIAKLGILQDAASKLRKALFTDE
ncbi:HTH-type transcriptional repressor AllR [Defluviimonas aquaemixtae]|uniref:HTH-type transcriptional repressor AllR n=1 Tax=Albidovulum aquaemixtae TaxID=1542388 RepID=A0A2R8B8A3_9RHOB|nr:IclR family transcriptional regulator [Defluviimonas aquaemixtae]SPH18822.1 HTH-type transcriptional repressor AllR [Defluviimonas aquaemixtae]